MCINNDSNNKNTTKAVHHPLDPLTPQEIQLAVKIVKQEFGVDKNDSTCLSFETIELLEPPKRAVRTFNNNQESSSVQPFERCARVNAFKTTTIGVHRFTLSLTHQTVLTRTFLPNARPMIQIEEFASVEETVKKDPRIIEACRKRGIHNMDLVCVDPWSSGTFGAHYEQDHRIIYTFMWLKSHKYDNLYAHPVEGLNVVVDVNALKVIAVEDRGQDIPIPKRNVNYDSEFALDDDMPKPRQDLKPIHVIQPDGVSFSMNGRTIQWHDWSLLIGFNGREGITLHNGHYAGRPVFYRMSLAEMVVPYGSPREPHYRKNVADIGEYGLGNMANSLKLGCDCLGVIQYLDCWINDMKGDPLCIPNGICIHEEDFGILWKHWDFRTDRTAVRRARRLVISSISTVGNYEYGSYWYFYLDGTVEFEMKATGIINTVACLPGSPEKYGTEVSPGVVGQIHQHMFCARIDLSIDGDDNNTVLECDTVAEPTSTANPYGNAYYVQSTPLTIEGGRQRNPDTERFWKFINAAKKNFCGQPVAYKLEPMHAIRPFTQRDSPSGRRMGWVYNHLWVTPFHPEERYPAGDYVNQSIGDTEDGIIKYTEQKRSIQDTDLVAWHVFGLHHPVRPEDFPVQNCVSTGFKLAPAGFFNGNPNMDLPAGANAESKHACCK